MSEQKTIFHDLKGESSFLIRSILIGLDYPQYVGRARRVREQRPQRLAPRLICACPLSLTVDSHSNLPADKEKAGAVCKPFLLLSLSKIGAE